MILQDPVTDIHHMNVLLHNDVSGERDVPVPVSKPQLILRHRSWALRISIFGRIIVRRDAYESPQRTPLYPPHQLNEGRSAPDLEPHVHAYLSLDMLGNFQGSLSLRNIDTPRL